MKRPLAFLGCGLLVVALGTFGAGCKSKSKTMGDASVDGSAGTGGGGGSSGKGGAGGSSGDGGALTAAQCTTMTAALGTPMACAMCGCAKNLMQAGACLKDKMCWPLISCASSMCAPNDTACITMKCASSISGATTATPFGMTLSSMCAKECPPTFKPNGGGTDGGASDAGH
jgi:hypothetical protein